MLPSHNLSAVDLFSGCGGLTVGLKRAGFNVVSGVELEQHAFSTYKVNHPEVKAFLQDIRTVHGEDLYRNRFQKKLDLLAGCPPCQGFSSLTSKWHKPDPRNDLVLEMGRLVRELRPRVVMMENVPGLALKGMPILSKFVRSLRAMGYKVKWEILQVADYGVPQLRRRFVLLAGLGFSIPLPSPSHANGGAGGLKPWRTLKDAISRQPPPLRFDKASELGGPGSVNWHVVRSISLANQRRLKHAVPGRGWTKIPKRLRPKCHQDQKVGFRNAYGRMSWDEPSPTITGGCTTLSKGRFGHPDEARTISVREAALIQTFPAGYVFDSSYIDRVCDMVGNALPCDFAAVVAAACSAALASQGAAP